MVEKINEIDAILDAIHDDVLITDGKGVVLRVSKSFENFYGIKKEMAIGNTVYQLEKDGIFKPSIIAIVLETGKKITMRQKNKSDRHILVTATPVKNEDGKIVKVVSFSRDITELLQLKEELQELRNNQVLVGEIIAKSVTSQDILKTINRIAKFDANVLLTGESGVGKTMYAKWIHNKSNRDKGPFIEINCGAIPENLLESELFGYEKGSFTGAGREGKSGLIELSEGGTLFLDEISDLPLNLQVKLLKAIQDKVIIKVGGTKEKKVDFRLIAASNRPFESLIRNNLFREDLYYRLNVISIEIPPLRERVEDITPLSLFFLEKFNESYGLNVAIHSTVYQILEQYYWPGNIRELENLLERLILTSEEECITEKNLPSFILKNKSYGTTARNDESLAEALECLEKSLVVAAYERHKTTVGVAKALKISQPTAVRKIQKYFK